MAVYWFSFTPNPADSSNLSPTFLNFVKFDGTTLAPPGITQIATGTGLYQFTYTPSFSIAFRIDGATTGLTTDQRYIRNSIDPLDQLDVQVSSLGSSLSVVSAGIGTTASIYGGVSLEPVDLFGYLKWCKEFLAGNQSFSKTTGSWNIYSRSNATLLITKSLTNDVNGVTRG
jgi:hypothetical protein